MSTTTKHYPSAPLVTPVGARVVLARDLAIGSNSTATDFAAIACSESRPTGVRPRENAIGLFVMPFGIGNAAQTYNFRVIRWFYGGDLWVPQVAVNCTPALSTTVGLSTSTLALDTEKFANDLGTVTAPDSPECIVYEPATAGFIASISLDLRGCDGFSFDYDMVTATSGNCLFGLF